MNYKQKIILLLVFISFADKNFYAQTIQGTVKNSLVFSAIRGTVSKPDSIALPSTSKYFKLTDGDTAYFKILTESSKKCIVVFKPAVDFTGIAKAKIKITSSSGKLLTEIDLTGLSTKALEGENEAPLSVIVDALGYSVDLGWTSLANHIRPELQGDELSSSLFQKAGSSKVEIIPVARYSPDFNLPFGYYVIKESKPDLQQVGVLAKAGTFPEHQTLFPSMESGSNFFDPGKNSFGFYATSPTHSAYSEDVWNMLYYPDNAVHATRIYQLKNKNGKPLINTYLLCFEEAKNGDYNDYVFIVKNIIPVTKDPFVKLFNGKNLEGWNMFLRKIGSNTDPNKNFKIENSELHVSGKDLGYVITQKGYKNFHFKVDFKWGEKRWPPRENEKRDAGVCYNIPVNEPDSIWPQSIECQIQEGDVGDFWLLGFSTIKVNGIQNQPANHTRMIKQKDAEKFYGEWNTVEIISYNGRCVHIVNGVIVNVGEEASIKEGRILLQSEYAEIYYRNVRIREL